MRHPRVLLTALLVLLFTPSFLLAQTAEPAKDPVDAAIDTIWNVSHAEGYYTITSGMELDRARKLLIAQRDQSFQKVAALLDNNELPVRLNGAIVLAGMAQAGGNSPELLQALTRCVADSNPAMALWGVQGIIGNSAFAPADRVAALTQCLTPARPRPLRVAAALAAGDEKLTQAIPVLIAYLESIQEAYRKQVDAVLTPQRGGRYDVGAGGAEAPSTATPSQPTYAIAGSAPAGGVRTPTGAAATPGTSRVGGPARPVAPSPTAPGGPRLPGGGMPPGGVMPPGTGILPGTGMRPGGGVVPGSRVPGQSEIDAAARQPLPPIDASKLTLQEQTPLFVQLEELPTVQELHHIGLALDALVKNAFPAQDAAFDFDTTPPWALDECVEKAAKWLAANQAAFAAPAAPAPAKTPAAVPPPAAPAVDEIEK